MTQSPQIFYWSPGGATAPTALGADDHYFRLGAYVPSQEPSAAGVGGEGIFFYTSGKYTLKSTAGLHAAVNGPVTRTVETGDWTYTNDGATASGGTPLANFSITAEEGAVKMTAKDSISIASSMETTDDSTSIAVEAGATGTEKDVYYQQGEYFKFMKEYEEKLVNAHAHKSNIGLLINNHLGVGTTTSLTFELSYTSLALDFTGMDVSVTGLAINIESNKGNIAWRTMSFTLIEGKKIFLDEEFCGVKNETKWVRFKQGFTNFYTNWCFWWDQKSAGELDNASVKAEFVKMGIEV
jgi:hypothetical protein